MKIVKLRRRFDASRHLSSLAPAQVVCVASLLEPLGLERDTVVPILQRIWRFTDRSSFERSQ
jgi:hypothetical protein